ncbi:MAG: purine-binding chemotaxis protein CheW [Clostridiales bacterium]|nr:purine-binding chemotaxis protein CheW [Clostridiales bacterium]
MEEIRNEEIKKYLVFKLGNEEYGVDIQKISTINEMENTITRVPKTASYIKGVINLRGEIIPIIDMRAKFSLPAVDYTEDTRVIIVKIEEVTIGFIVDAVNEVVELGEDSIESITGLSASLTQDYLLGVGKIEQRIVTLLNLEKFFMQV